MEPNIVDETDERLRQELAVESPRASRAGGAARRSREADDRAVVEDRELSEDERLELFRHTLFNDVLPDLPSIPGYHVCWLSTNHPNDTLPRRMRLGYELIRGEDIPGFEFVTLKTGEYAGCVGINEMLAFKLPLSLYRKYMQVAHHEQPAEQDRAIVAQAENLRLEAQRAGGDVIEGDGLAELRRSAPSRGIFSD